MKMMENNWRKDVIGWEGQCKEKIKKKKKGENKRSICCDCLNKQIKKTIKGIVWKRKDEKKEVEMKKIDKKMKEDWKGG